MKNECKKVIKADGKVLGTFVTLNSVEASELLATAGYDYLIVDFEHGAMGLETAGRQMSAIGKHTTPLLRIPELTLENCKKGLDSGAYGLMVPMVKTREDVEKFVSYTSFPPKGVRGAGATRANMFYTQADKYFEFADTEILRIIQIETKEALDNLDEILSVQGIDVAFLGPYDMSFALGVPGEVSGPEVTEAADKIVKSCVRHGVCPGIMTNPSDMKRHGDMGFRFLLDGLDSFLLFNGAKGSIAHYKKCFE